MRILYVAKHGSGDNGRIHNYSPPEKRFWAKVNKNGPSAGRLGRCWVWEGQTWGGGYGCLVVRGSRHRAHRYSYILNVGPVLTCEKICHRCDNPRCVRPNHLFIGTDKDNLADMARKGRANRGEDRPAAKLTEAQVREIRQRYRKVSPGHGNGGQLAREFGVSKTAILYAVLGRNWRYLT